MIDSRLAMIELRLGNSLLIKQSKHPALAMMSRADLPTPALTKSLIQSLISFHSLACCLATRIFSIPAAPIPFKEAKPKIILPS